MIIKCSLLVFLLSASLFSFSSEIPTLTGPVVDKAGLLSDRSIFKLSQKIRSFKETYGPQLQVLIIESLHDVPIEQYSIEVVEKWKIGDAKKDDGVLFLIATKDRKMRIEVGQGLEGRLPDILAGRIIQQVSPQFRSGKFDDGVALVMQSIMDILSSDRPPSSYLKKSKHKVRGVNVIFFFILIFFLFLTRNQGLRRSSRRGYYGGGFGGGFGGGGGGWSGGGGGFSGGGASGGW